MKLFIIKFYINLKHPSEDKITICELVLLNGCHAALTILIPLFDEYISAPTVIILYIYINNNFYM